MEKDMLATIALFLWIIGFYLVAKYRIHIHVHIESRIRQEDRRDSRADRRIHRTMGAALSGEQIPKGAETVDRAMVANVSDVREALVGLGCSKAKARQIAEKVCAQPGTFDELLRMAIREAA
jgi:RuvA, C-terminal domain